MQLNIQIEDELEIKNLHKALSTSMAQFNSIPTNSFYMMYDKVEDELLELHSQIKINL